MQIKLVLFWFLYTLLAVWGQYLFPRMDFLTPGLVVLLQLGSWHAAISLAVVWMLLQEGTANLSFGVFILFYAGGGLFFYLSRVFFEVRNVLFAAVFLLFLTGLKMVLVQVMAPLQDLTPAAQMGFKIFLLQFGVYFGVWMLTYNSYHKWLDNESIPGKRSVT